MGIDELFEGVGRNHRKRHDYSYDDYDDHGHRRPNENGRHNGEGHHGSGGHAMYLDYARKLLSNKKLLAVFIVAAIIALILAVMIVIWLVSLLGPAMGLLEKNGIKGIVDALAPIFQKFWEGSGK
jgi:hypothetical protein